jgi:predicted transcriptional regulator
MEAKDLMVPSQKYLNPDNIFKEKTDFLWIARSEEEKVLYFVTQKDLRVKEEASIKEHIDHMPKHNVERMLVFIKWNKIIGILYGRAICSFIAIIADRGSAS